MGQGGCITLVNATDKNWHRTHQHSYQMNSWDFPETILAKTSVKVYVEWDQGIFTCKSDDAGEAVYTLEGTDNSFQVQARANNGFHLQIYFDNLETNGNVKNSVLNLGWTHDGVVNFILAGQGNNYTGTNLYADRWMQDNLSIIGEKTLKNICITGSHDAGMSVRTSGTAAGFECNTLTQSNNIQVQLHLGARYFDIRPVISAGSYYTGHYGHIGDTTWQGANGQSIKSIISDINAFTENHQELVILNLSHSLNTDVGNNSYRSFNQTEWDELFNELSDINNLFVMNDYTDNVDLTDKTLNSFISKGAAVLVIIEDKNVDLKDKSGQGFYHYRNFNAYNKYADSNDVNTMVEDQIRKMFEHYESYFLLSWTLTQNDLQAATCFLGIEASIKKLADEANQNLAYRLYPVISSSCYPNIIYIDNIINSEFTAMAVAINYSI